MRKVAFLSSPALWERGHGPEHPLKPERLQRTHELLDSYGAFDWEGVQVVSPRSPSGDALALFHSREYIHAVRELSDGKSDIPTHRYNFGPGDNPVFPGMYVSEGLKVGSTLQAAEILVNGGADVAFSYAGGLHHGGSDFASGFCVFNDAAVAIQWLLNQSLRVAYVDIDVHHGDGVQAAFYDTPQVLTISLHQDGRTLFPGTGYVEESGRGPGGGYSVNLPLPPFTDDETYLWAFNQVAPPLLERFAADILVTQLGVDTHFQDPLANLALTTRGHAALFDALSRLSSRWLALGGGGYNIDVVPRSWALAFAAMARRSLPDRLPTAYRSRYGGESLHDEQAPTIDGATRRRVRAAVESVVAIVQRLHKI